MSLHRTHARVAATVLLAIVTVLIAASASACSNPWTASQPSAEATISALATSNAQLSTQVAELVAAAGLPTPTPQPIPAAPETGTAQASSASASAAPPVARPGNGPLPQLLAEIPLAPEGETIYDLRIDRASNHIFVTDSADQLHVLDATTYQPLTVLPYGGWLELDSDHSRLYVYKPYITQEESLIYVIDTNTLETVGTIPGRAIAIDSQHNRLFIGEPYTISTEEDSPGVRVVDGATLEQTGIFTQAGAPLYNPLRNELLISAYTAYTANPDTQQITGDLFPELTDIGESGFLWCNGCAWVDNIRFFPVEQLLAVEISRHCAGKGCGTEDAPPYLDANTLQPLDTATIPQMQADCGSQASLVNQVDGKRYVDLLYDRYVVFTNLLVTDAVGAPLTLRDGLRIEYVNPRTGQGYLYDGTVLDLAALAPIGRWPAACLMAEELDHGLLYGYRNGNLYVIAERGGDPAPSAGPVAENLPEGSPIHQIAVSPNYAGDTTLLAVVGGDIYRSTDNGEQWQRLRGSLPDVTDSMWTVAFSPAYASDSTIFAGGQRGEYWGEGVWRSSDGGESWQAQWDNLQHRRIKQFYLDPEFATSQTLVAQADYYDVATSQSGESYQQSSDGGLTWTLVATGTMYSSGPDALPPISELLPDYVEPPSLPARINDLHNGLEVTLDGSTWITVPLTMPEAEWLYALLPAPGYPNVPTLYAFGQLSLWRSTDNGATWSPWEDARLNGLDYKNEMSAATVSPSTADGGYRLFVGTNDGQVWMLDPAQMTWGDPIASAPEQVSPVAAAAPMTTTAAVAVPAPAPSTTEAVTSATTAITATTLVTQAQAGIPTPAVTAEPLAGEPPAGLFRPQGSLGIVWEANPRIQQDLGWARQETPSAVAGAYQRFEGGVMVWRQDTSQIFAFVNDGTWRSFADTFREGDPESDPRFAPPGGNQQPIRGFGKVWRDNPDLREQLGWATAKEEAQQAEIHLFERGTMLRYGGMLFTVLGVDTDKGRWY